MNINTSSEPRGIGILALQHKAFDKAKGPLGAWDIVLRASIQAVRVTGRNDSGAEGLGQWIYDPESAGDIHGGQLLYRNSRDIPMWRFATPVVVFSGGGGTSTGPSGVTQKTPGGLVGPDVATGPGGGAATCGVLRRFSVLPVFDDLYNPDERLQEIDAKVPKSDGKEVWPKFPRGFVGISLVSNLESEQIDLFHPTDPRMIAVHRKGDAMMGSLVCDMGDEFKIANDRTARLQSVFRVLKTPTYCGGVEGGGGSTSVQLPDKTLPNVISWNLGPTGCEDTRGGYVFEKRALSSTAPKPDTPTPGGGRPDTPTQSARDSGSLPLPPAQVGGGIPQLGIGPAAGPVPRFGGAAGAGAGGAAGAGAGGGAGVGAGGEAGAVPKPGDGGSKNGGVAALISHYDSGHSDVGSDTDKHQIGKDKDGNPINALHISTNALFRKDDKKDAPLEFGGNYIPPLHGRYLVHTFLRYDDDPKHPFVCGDKKGLWKWESECHLHEVIVPPDKPPPPGPPPPPSVPPPVPTGKTRPFPGDGSGGGSGSGDGAAPPVLEVQGIPTIRQWNFGIQDGYVASEIATAYPAIFGRPQNTAPNAYDLRSPLGVRVPSSLQQAIDRFTPVSGRIEAFGKIAAGDWVYTQKPGKGRFPGGTTPGGFALMPPEFDIMDATSNFSRGGITGSTTYFCAVPGTYLALGIPVPSTGGIKTGYRIGSDSSGNVTIDRLNSSGTATNVATLESDGTVALPADTTLKMGSGSGASKAKGTFYSSIDAVGNVGTGEDTLHTFPLAANALSSDNSVVHISAHGSFAAASTTTLKFHFGGTSTTLVNASAAPAGMNWAADINVIRVNSGTQTMRIRFWASAVDSALSGTSYTRVYAAGASETDTAAITIKFTGEGTNNNDVLQNMTVAEFYNAP